MSIRIIGIGKYTGDDITWLRCENFMDATCENVYDAKDLDIRDTDKLAIILAYDNFQVATEVARAFHQADVLTLGLFPEIIKERSCLDAQTIFKGWGLSSIIGSILHPMIYPCSIDFDFNEIRDTLKDSKRFYTWYEFADNMEALVQKCKSYLNSIDLNEVEKACFNLYHVYPFDPRPYDMEMLKEVMDFMPAECQLSWGIHKVTGWDYPGLSLILSGKELEINRPGY